MEENRELSVPPHPILVISPLLFHVSLLGQHQRFWINVRPMSGLSGTCIYNHHQPQINEKCTWTPIMYLCYLYLFLYSKCVPAHFVTSNQCTWYTCCVKASRCQATLEAPKIIQIFTLLNLRLANATHNSKWLKITHLFNLRPNITKSWCVNTHFVPGNCDLTLSSLIYHCHLHPLQAANCCRNSRLNSGWRWSVVCEKVKKIAMYW